MATQLELSDAGRLAMEAAQLLMVGEVSDETCAALLRPVPDLVSGVPVSASESQIAALRDGIVAMTGFGEWCEGNDAPLSAREAGSLTVAFLLTMAKEMQACR